MNNLLHTIRKEFSFSQEIEPSLERRLFRLLCLTITFITFFLLIPSNFIQKLPLTVNATLAFLGCGSIILYRAAIRGNHYNKALLAMLLATINVTWCSIGGSDGCVPYFFFPICLFPLIILHGKNRWATLVAIIVNGCVLIWLSYRYPWLVTTFKSPFDRIIDLMIGLVISACACIMVFCVVLSTYLREHDRLNQLNLKLEHEIAERMRREEEIHELAGEHRLILDTIPIGIIYVRERRTQWANPTYEKMFGYTLQELLGMDTALHYADHADYERIGIDGYKCISDGDKYTTEVKMKKNDGSLFLCSMTGCAVNLENPADGSIWMLQDISERKRAKDELRESEERYRGLVELSPDAIYTHCRGKLIFVNSKGAKLLGAERPEDLYGREALDFVHPDSREFVQQRIAKAFHSGEPNPPGEEIFVRVDGAQVPVEVASVPFRYKGENALLAIARDITERRRVQDELLKAQKLESLGLLAGGIAHDFNNILTGIVGNLSIAKLQIDRSHKIVKHLELSEMAAIRATQLTRQLLTFARGGEPVKKLIKPASLIRDAVSFALRGSNIRSIIDIQDNLWSMEVDESQLDQVLNNLLLNASQAMPEGGEITVWAVNETLLQDNPQQLPPGDYVRIAVEDHGCGISQEDLVRIFDPYFTTKTKGSGLGLTSVYSIIKRHGGAVGVSSALAEGTTFTIHIPAIPGRLPQDSYVHEPVELTGSGRVLVMDDEDLIREIGTHILDFMGYEVDCCADGEEAVELFQAARKNNAPYSAVILDLTIPGGMGGKEAATRILELDPNAVLIASSGYSSDPVIANFRHYGFSGVVPKPFDAEGLARELKRSIPNNC
jgi:PAS domain S-box-containing protein